MSPASGSQQTLDGTPAERLHRYLQSTRSDLIDSGIYIGDPSNSFRQDVEWKRHGHGNYLVFKDADTACQWNTKLRLQRRFYSRTQTSNSFCGCSVELWRLLAHSMRELEGTNASNEEFRRFKTFIFRRAAYQLRRLPERLYLYYQ